MLICFIVGPSFLVKCPIFAVRCSQKSLSENQTKSKSPQSWWRPLQLQILLHAYHIHYKFSYCTKKKCPKLPRSILTLASFPALQATESWVGPGNEAILTQWGLLGCPARSLQTLMTNTLHRHFALCRCWCNCWWCYWWPHWCSAAHSSCAAPCVLLCDQATTRSVSHKYDDQQTHYSRAVRSVVDLYFSLVLVAAN